MLSALLAAAVDKSQQMSDWSARPLTDRQQRYAALDAFVLVQLFGVLKERLRPDTTQQLVKQHTKTINRVSEPSMVALLLDTSNGAVVSSVGAWQAGGSAHRWQQALTLREGCCALALPMV